MCTLLMCGASIRQVVMHSATTNKTYNIEPYRINNVIKCGCRQDGYFLLALALEFTLIGHTDSYINGTGISIAFRSIKLQRLP